MLVQSAPIRRHQCWNWSTQGSHTTPLSSRCSCQWTYPSVECCSTLDGVEAFLRLCLLRVPSWGSPMPLLRFGLSDVAEHVIMNTWCKAVQHMTRCLLPSWVVDMCLVGLVFVCSFDITPIALADLVYLVLPRCEVVSIDFLGRRTLPIWVFMLLHLWFLLLLYVTNYVGCCYNDQPVLCERGLAGGLQSSYQALLYHCKELGVILCSKRDVFVFVFVCVCKWEREREREKMYIDTENRIRKLMY